MAFEMYQQQILDHAKHPRHLGLLAPADATAHAANPLCGDELDFSVRVRDGRVIEIGFQGDGCTISRAAASLLAEHSVGKDLADLVGLTVNESVALLGITVNPARLKCATLGLEALQQALKTLSTKPN